MTSLRLTFIFCLFICKIEIFSQKNWEFGYSFGANATTVVSIKTEDKIWGYKTPPIPNTWTNHWSLGYGDLKNKIFLAFDGGALGPTIWVDTYADKYPLGSHYVPVSEYSVGSTKLQAGMRSNTSLSKLSILWKRNFKTTAKTAQMSVLGLGFLRTRVASGGASWGSGLYSPELGQVEHYIVRTPYNYLQLINFYVIGGYQFTYKLNSKINVNAQIFYNQGISKMFWWRSYRVFSESATGYSEYDEQLSYTRLSYFAFLTGISYDFNFAKPHNQPHRRD